jgi:hypothetical protein
MATYIERFIENERDSRHAADRLRTETISLDLNMKVKLYDRPTTLKPMFCTTMVVLLLLGYFVALCRVNIISVSYCIVYAALFLHARSRRGMYGGRVTNCHSWILREFRKTLESSVVKRSTANPVVNINTKVEPFRFNGSLFYWRWSKSLTMYLHIHTIIIYLVSRLDLLVLGPIGIGLGLRSFQKILRSSRVVPTERAVDRASMDSVLL